MVKSLPMSDHGASHSSLPVTEQFFLCDSVVMECDFGTPSRGGGEHGCWAGGSTHDRLHCVGQGYGGVFGALSSLSYTQLRYLYIFQITLVIEKQKVVQSKALGAGL